MSQYSIQLFLEVRCAGLLRKEKVGKRTSEDLLAHSGCFGLLLCDVCWHIEIPLIFFNGISNVKQFFSNGDPTDFVMLSFGFESLIELLAYWIIPYCRKGRVI